MDSKSVRLSGGARRRKSVKKTSKKLSKTKGKINSHKMSGGARRRSKTSSKKRGSKTKGKKMSGGARRRSKKTSKTKYSKRRNQKGGLTLKFPNYQIPEDEVDAVQKKAKEIIDANKDANLMLKASPVLNKITALKATTPDQSDTINMAAADLDNFKAIHSLVLPPTRPRANAVSEPKK